jgi:hypothetical protein
MKYRCLKLGSKTLHSVCFVAANKDAEFDCFCPKSDSGLFGYDHDIAIRANLSLRKDQQEINSAKVKDVDALRQKKIVDLASLDDLDLASLDDDIDSAGPKLAITRIKAQDIKMETKDTLCSTSAEFPLEIELNPLDPFKIVPCETRSQIVKTEAPLVNAKRKPPHQTEAHYPLIKYESSLAAAPPFPKRIKLIVKQEIPTRVIKPAGTDRYDLSSFIYLLNRW